MRLFGVVIAVCFIAAANAAAATHRDSVAGAEYRATSTDGRFAGAASGELPGTWKADVHHTALCISCSSTATITSGSFTLATIVDGLPALFRGSFSGGTVQVIKPGADCTNQKFAVDGLLSRVHGRVAGTGGGTFTATLTHYRHSIFGRCVTYAASIRGTLDIGF